MTSKVRTALATVCLVAIIAGGYAPLALAASVTATQDVTLVVSSIAKLAVTGDPGPLIITAPVGAGDEPAPVSDGSTAANYTSTVPAGQTRKLQVQGTAATGVGIPAGCTLTLTPTMQGGGYGASKGIVSGPQTISQPPEPTAHDIVTNIPTCGTGVGAGFGVKLTYALSVATFTALVGGTSGTVTMTFTLTDAS